MNYADQGHRLSFWRGFATTSPTKIASVPRPVLSICVLRLCKAPGYLVIADVAMMSSTNECVVKCSKERVDALVASGTRKRFELQPEGEISLPPVDNLLAGIGYLPPWWLKSLWTTIPGFWRKEGLGGNQGCTLGPRCPRTSRLRPPHRGR